MAKSGIIAIVVGLAAVLLVVFAATDRQMGQPEFIILAYAVTAAVIVGYVVLLTGQLLRAERDEKAGNGGSKPPLL